MNPGVQKGQAQEKGGMVAVLQHKYPVRDAPLEFYIYGNDIHRPPVGLGHLLKTQHNIVPKLVGGVDFHVFHQDAQGFPFFLLASIDIAQLHSRLQYLLAHFLADIPGIVQSFGNGAFGYSQLFCDIVYRGHEQPSP